MRYPKLRELREAVKALVKGPYTTKFPYEPHVPEARFRGKPEYQEKDCVGCGACFEVCPADAIEKIDIVETNGERPPVRRLVVRLENCIFCGQCHTNCITEKGIVLTQEYDLATFDRKDAIESVEKELVLCEVCGSVITTRDHLKWLAKRLGPLAYGNPTLILASQRELIPQKPSGEAEVYREDTFKILGPKCRHKVTLKDIWG